jgi:hypothetical protein
MTTLQLAIDGKTHAFSRYASAAARILMGALFLFAGLNGLLRFFPDPPPDAMPAGAMALSVALMKSGYLMPLIGATQATAGALLLSNRFVPLALTLLAPIVVNIVAFHAVLAPQGLAVALVVMALEIYLAAVHRDAFRSVLAIR